MPRRKRRITGKVLEQFDYQCVSCGSFVRRGADLTEFERRHGRLAALLTKDVALCQPCVDRMTEEGPDLAPITAAAIEKAFTPPSEEAHDPHDPLECPICIQIREVDRSVYGKDPDHCHICKRHCRDVSYDIELVWSKEIRMHTFENFKPENLLFACRECKKQLGLNRASPRLPEQSRVLLAKDGVIYVEFEKKPS